MNYEIITDNNILHGFINWLPELQAHETFYLCLFARSKYCKEILHIRSDKAQLKRFTSDKSYMYDKIKQLECPIGSYKQRGVSMPQEALSLYISANPRDLVVATKNSVKKLLDLSYLEYNGYNPQAECMSEIQKAKSRSVYVDIDFDSLELKSIKAEIETYINGDAVTYLQTRGGFHAMINTHLIGEEFKKTWFNKITGIEGCDYSRDTMIPVPGTYQGGFTPYIVAK